MSKANKEPLITEAPKIHPVVSTDNVKLAARTWSRVSLYAGIFAAMTALKPGTGFKVDVPKGLSLKTFQNRLGAGRRKAQKQANDDKSRMNIEYYFNRTAENPERLYVGARVKASSTAGK